jgi:hypothetical protein
MSGSRSASGRVLVPAWLSAARPPSHYIVRIRTEPFVRAGSQAYRNDGLVVIWSSHAEVSFEHEANPSYGRRSPNKGLPTYMR